MFRGGFTDKMIKDPDEFSGDGSVVLCCGSCSLLRCGGGSVRTCWICSSAGLSEGKTVSVCKERILGGFVPVKSEEPRPVLKEGLIYTKLDSDVFVLQTNGDHRDVLTFHAAQEAVVSSAKCS